MWFGLGEFPIRAKKRKPGIFTSIGWGQACTQALLRSTTPGVGMSVELVSRLAWPPAPPVPTIGLQNHAEIHPSLIALLVLPN